MSNRKSLHTLLGAPRHESDSGFIALITAILLGAILMTVALSISTTGFFTRGQLLDAEYKERSRSLAEACVDVALLKLTANPLYTPPAGGETIPAAGANCVISLITATGSNVTIVTIAGFPDSTNGAVTKLSVVANKSTLAISSWTELP